MVATCKQIVNSKQGSMPAHYLVNEKQNTHNVES